MDCVDSVRMQICFQSPPEIELGKWVKHPDGRLPPGSFPDKIPLRELPDALVMLGERLPIKLAQDRAYSRRELEAIDTTCDTLQRALARVHPEQPPDLRMILTNWDDEATNHVAGGYAARFASGRTKLGESENLQRRTSPTSQPGIVMRAIFMLCRDMLENGFLLQEEINELANLPLPMLDGCVKSNKKFEPKVMRQMSEALGVAEFALPAGDDGRKDTSKIGEFILQFPTDNLRKITDPREMMEYLENSPDYEKFCKWMAPIASLFECNTWATLKSFIAEKYPALEHLHKAHKHKDLFVSRHLSLLTVNEDRFDGMENVCSGTPYLAKNNRLIERLESLVGESASRSDEELAEEIWATLDDMDEDHYFPPDDHSHAVEAMQMIKERLESESISCMHIVRGTTADCLRENEATKKWFGQMFSEQIELEGPSIPMGRSGEMVKSPMILHKTKTGHVVLEVGAEFLAFSPDQSYRQRFCALQGLVNRAVVNRYAGLLDDAGLRRIWKMACSASLIISGPNSSLSDPKGSWINAIHFTFPDGLVSFKHPKGAGALKMAFKEKIPYYMILCLMERLGDEGFERLLKLLGSDYRMQLMGKGKKKKWILLELCDGEYKAQYEQFNKITREKWEAKAMAEIDALVESSDDIGGDDLKLFLEALFNDKKTSTKKTNNPRAANQERLDVIVAAIREKYPSEAADDLCRALEENTKKEVDGHEAKWWRNFDAFAAHIEETYPGGLDSSKVYVPLQREIGSKLHAWYLRALGFEGRKSANEGVTGIKRSELECLGIKFDKSGITAALKESAAMLTRESTNKNVAMLQAQKEKKRLSRGG